MPRVRVAVIVSLFTAAALPAAYAAQPDFSDKAFVTGAAQVATVDVLAAHCPEAARTGTAEHNALTAWEARNGAAAVRRVAESTAEGRSGFRTIKDNLETRMAPVLGQACTALSQWLASPSADIDPAYRTQLAGVETPRSLAPALAKTPMKIRPAVPGIAGYGLIQSYGLGYGGMVVVRYEPAVLFASGDILLDVTGLSDPGGIGADKAAHPDHWSKWRKTGGTYQYAERSGKWNGILNNQVWTTAPSAAGLAGHFTATGGGGNTALGGTSSVFTQTGYTFQPGGRVVREGLASAASEAGNARAVTGSHGSHSGRFTIDGLTLTITYDDGSRETAVLMTHPTDKDIIWIDGTAYTRE